MISPVTKLLVQNGKVAKWRSGNMAEVISAPLHLCVKKAWEVQAWAN